MAQKELISRHRLKMKSRYSRPVVWTGWEEGQRQTILQRRTSEILGAHFMDKEDEKVIQKSQVPRPQLQSQGHKQGH